MKYNLLCFTVKGIYSIRSNNESPEGLKSATEMFINFDSPYGTESNGIKFALIRKAILIL